MVTPTASSRATPSTVAASRPANSGGFGSMGARAMARAPATRTRSRSGTARVPMRGMAISSAPVRSMVHMTVPIMPKACRPSITIEVAGSTAVVSADQVGNALEQGRGVVDQVSQQETAHREHGGGQGDGLGDEGDGRFVDLGRGLDDADDHAHGKHGQQQRSADPEGDLEATAQFGKGEFGAHGGGRCKVGATRRWRPSGTAQLSRLRLPRRLLLLLLLPRPLLLLLLLPCPAGYSEPSIGVPAGA